MPLTPPNLDDLIRAEVTYQLTPQITRLVKQAIALELNEAPNHGLRWSKQDEEELFHALNTWTRTHSALLGRTEAGIRIKILRYMRHHYAEDWSVALRGSL